MKLLIMILFFPVVAVAQKDLRHDAPPKCLEKYLRSDKKTEIKDVLFVLKEAW